MPTSWPFTDLAMDSVTGCLYGTPPAIAIADVEVTATTAKGASRSDSFTIEIDPAQGDTIQVGVKSVSLTPQPTGQAYRAPLIAFGGQGRYIWRTMSTFPQGLQLDPSGYIIGKPDTKGVTTVKVTATDTNNHSSAEATIAISINSAPDCGNPKYGDPQYFNGWTPLSTKRSRNLDPNGHTAPASPTNNDVVCFYQATGPVAPLGQVQYLYGIDQGTNTISADLVAIQFPAPFGLRVALGSSVTGGGNASTSSAQATAASTLATIQAGGNFYLHALYPIYVYNNNALQFVATGNAKLGFSFDGFAGQSTLSQATEKYVSVPFEAYAEYHAIGNAGGFYGDYSAGYQNVPDSFKTAAGLSTNNFFLQQMSFGVSFAGLVRVGAQRYVGPAAAFGATTGADFKNWHLVIQLNPTKGS
ncbi:MAG TPA: putative Ig domain-containing protein [Candidatus Angelobacter sp.]